MKYRINRRDTGSKAHKYGAVRTTVDNIRFASRLEAARYGELKLLLKAGQITDLELQPRFVLTIRRTLCSPVKLGTYIADFRYLDMETSAEIFEDVKGFDVPLQKWKRRHAEIQYGIVVTLYPPRVTATRRK